MLAALPCSKRAWEASTRKPLSMKLAADRAIQLVAPANLASTVAVKFPLSGLERAAIPRALDLEKLACHDHGTAFYPRCRHIYRCAGDGRYAVQRRRLGYARELEAGSCRVAIAERETGIDHLHGRGGECVARQTCGGGLDLDPFSSASMPVAWLAM